MGERGPEGFASNTGCTGTTGPIGEIGNTGPTGCTGPEGRLNGAVDVLEEEVALLGGLDEIIGQDIPPPPVEPIDPINPVDPVIPYPRYPTDFLTKGGLIGWSVANTAAI
eukprot:gene17697-36275_t